MDFGMEVDDVRGARPGAYRGVRIVPFAPSHVKWIARMHSESLTGLLASLGPWAVRAYYAGASQAPEAVGYVAYDGEHVVGFVLGSAHPAELRRQIAQLNRKALLASVARGLISRPYLLWWLVRSRRGPAEGTYDSVGPELIYLAVLRDVRGSGTGRLLVEAFGEAIKRRGADAYELSVDDTNTSAIGFYEKLGFRAVGRYREFGIWHRRYRLELIS